MAAHSSILAWKIPWTEEPDRLQSMGSQRVGQDWATFHFHFPIVRGLLGPSFVHGQRTFTDLQALGILEEAFYGDSQNALQI